MPQPLVAYVRIMDRLAGWTGLVAMYLVFVMIAVLLLDAVTRDIFHISLSWCIEAAQFTLTAYYFLGGPISLRDNDHVRMDLIYDRMSLRGKAWMDFATMVCLLTYLVVLTIGSFSSLQYAIETGERRFSMWNPSMIPIKMLMSLCLVLMVLQALAMVIKYWAEARGNPIAQHREREQDV